MNRAIFLDRDGVIIENVDHYVRSWADVCFLPGSLPALASLASSSFKIVVVTNQAVVGRKILSLAEAWDLNNRISAEIQRAGGRIDGVYICPHTPEDNCVCRKPSPGLILQAASDLDIDLERSYLVGDALSDLEAGKRAGIPHNLLVRTGRGQIQSRLPEASGLIAAQIFERMETAVAAILSGQI
jgi:D-glycero-D-manno-heptose 1,7-bisphosphate phosphatase